MLLPVFCYMVGAFATLTILTKNSLMENMAQDYVRTAFAKGLHERRVIFVHALRNSLIPIVTGLGHVISLILAGSFLIERVFNIDGMGYLGYTSILQRDYPVALGILVDRQPADARRQHPVRHHLRGGRSAHSLQMSPVRSETQFRRAPSQVPPPQARLLLVPAHHHRLPAVVPPAAADDQSALVVKYNGRYYFPILRISRRVRVRA